MNSRRYNFYIICCIFIILIVFMLIFSPQHVNYNDMNLYHQEYYIVNSGDTLWSIGKNYIGESVDIRDWIKNVEDINDLSSTIYPGQRIIIYVPNA